MLSKMPCCQRQKFAANLNEKAFTLIEALFALSIFSLIIFFMAPIFQIMLNNRPSQAALQKMEWADFASQFKKEIHQSIKAEVQSGRLLLTKESETVQYEKYGTNLRRQVNSLGHEIVLQNVSQYSFSVLPNAVKVTVQDFSGKEYSIIAYSYVDWNAAP
ncbi:competence type IV pilus minor pilin ComGF [Neobacillus fumarioli]|uniref:competence type IV pilus minor pilin ComGF n=1 Tax=Neobacillus fumarioli TaxID=105229 RepID=UPI001F34076F|nr:competence type IV pilus minor pilin ComGF [Neobacillus fumarioli]